MTHSKKLTIFFLTFATLFTCMLHVCFYQGNGDSFSSELSSKLSSGFPAKLSSELSSKLLRFRVLANSDSDEDQNVKNDLAKEVIALLSPALSDVQTKEEAITLVRESLPFLTAYCNTILSDNILCNDTSCNDTFCNDTSYNNTSCNDTSCNDRSYNDTSYDDMLLDEASDSDKSVTCTLGPHLFPYKTYGNYQFPSGIYDTLLVTIGEGRGSNWWCLAFPPLCFADEAFIDVPEPSAQMLMDVLDEDCYHAIVRNPNAQENLAEDVYSTDSITDTVTNSVANTIASTNTAEKPTLTLGLLSFLEHLFD